MKKCSLASLWTQCLILGQTHYLEAVTGTARPGLSHQCSVPWLLPFTGPQIPPSLQHFFHPLTNTHTHCLLIHPSIQHLCIEHTCASWCTRSWGCLRGNRTWDNIWSLAGESWALGAEEETLYVEGMGLWRREWEKALERNNWLVWL